MSLNRHLALSGPLHTMSIDPITAQQYGYELRQWIPDNSEMVYLPRHYQAEPVDPIMCERCEIRFASMFLEKGIYTCQVCYRSPEDVVKDL